MNWDDFLAKVSSPGDWLTFVLASATGAAAEIQWDLFTGPDIGSQIVGWGAGLGSVAIKRLLVGGVTSRKGRLREFTRQREIRFAVSNNLEMIAEHDGEVPKPIERAADDMRQDLDLAETEEALMALLNESRALRDAVLNGGAELEKAA